MRKPPKGFWIGLTLGVGLGVAAGLSAGKGRGEALPTAGGTELPLVEITVGRKNLRVLKAASRVAHVAAWNQGVLQKNPTLFVWKVPGIYPVMDVPSGWRVVWLREGRVLALGEIATEALNTNLPPEEVGSALVVPAGEGIVPGERVEGL